MRPLTAARRSDMRRREFLASTAAGVVTGVSPLFERRALARERAGAPPPPSIQHVQLLVFDTFGTVVDWRSSVIAEGEQLGRAKGLKVDWPAFADAWRGGYAPSLNRVRRGDLPWTKLDRLHRMVLDDLLLRFKITSLTEEE